MRAPSETRTGDVSVANHHELDDHQLIQLVAQAEKEALEALYSRYSSPVYSLAMYMLKQQALAEEVTQDIFLNIWLKAGSFKADRGAPKAWIMSVAHHKIIDVIRSRKRAIQSTEPANYDLLELLPASGISTEEQVEQTLERERILKALTVLPSAQKEVIMMAYFRGYSQSEMAEILNQPLGTIKTRVRLAMQKLRVVLDDDNK